MEGKSTRNDRIVGRLYGARRNSSMVSQALLAGATLTVVLLLAACGDDAKTKLSEKQTLKFTEQQGGDFGFADNPPKTQLGPEGPKKLSSGDQLTFSSEFLDRRERDVGELNVSCSITRPGGFDKSRQQCTGTATLPKGLLTLARGGRVFGGGDTSGAVVGGTGAYAGATGDFTEAEQKSGKTDYTFRIVVPER